MIDVSLWMQNDLDSIAICRSLIHQVNGKMLEFDFRNGNLRRKYDGLKYAIKKIEDITYDMSLVTWKKSMTTDIDQTAVAEAAAGRGGGIDVVDVTDTNDAKRRKITDHSYPVYEGPSLISDSTFDAIKDRMAQYDQQREDVIKRSRDVQKLAKQAVYSVHRGDVKDAQNKLKSAEKIANDIFSVIVRVRLLHLHYNKIPLLIISSP